MKTVEFITDATRTATFEDFQHDVYHWAFRLLGKHEDSLDVIQDVFLRWSEQCRRDPPSLPRPWLRRVTINRAVDRLREKRAQRQKENIPVTEDSTQPASASSDQEALRLDVAAALNRLTDLQRGVLAAKVFESQTFADIAAEYGVSMSTVKTHYLRAVRAVRDKLQPRWADGV